MESTQKALPLLIVGGNVPSRRGRTKHSRHLALLVTVAPVSHTLRPVPDVDAVATERGNSEARQYELRDLWTPECRCDMSRHMRTTVRLDDALLERAKLEADRRGETLTSIIERGLHLVLASPGKRNRRRRVEIPVCHKAGGTLPGVDIDDSAALLDVIEGRR
jgi:hypothetical protein